MKKLYRPLLKGTNWALAGLLSVLGGNIACDKNSGSDNMVEYGTPRASYAIRGKVTNSAGSAIPGIEIKAVADYLGGGWAPDSDSYPFKGITNTNGEYAIPLSTTGRSDFKIRAKDIDGEANGSYQTDSVLIKGSELKFTGGDKSWNEGRAEVTVDFTLKEENKKEE